MKPGPGSKPSPAVAAAAAQATARFKEAFALHQQGRVAEAKAQYEQVLKLWPRHAVALHLLGVIALEAGDTPEALRKLDAALAVAPEDSAAWNSKAVALHRLKQYPEALAACERSLALRPDVAEAQFNRGNTLMALKRRPEALANIDRAIELRPDYGKAHATRGLLLAEMLDNPGAVESFARATALRAELDLIRGPYLHARMRQCDWNGFEEQVREYLQLVYERRGQPSPLAVLSTTDSLALQRASAQAHIGLRQLAQRAAPAARPLAAGDRLRVGYFSMDFRAHAVSYLTAQVYELHDRSRFEVFAFSYGPDTGDETRKRLEHAFDHFVDIRERSDSEAADLARSLGIDIAVDLAGLTGDARTGIFALRAAPVQVSYIGYPGTMAAPYIDYLVADETLIPPGRANSYTEKMAWLPSFQANDRKRRISDRVFTRGELGLPAAGFVFGCFNRSHKITPQVFDGWCRVLARVPGSVLLLHEGDPATPGNLRREAQARGIAPERLVFAGSIPQDEYLSRYRVVDLFLDTFPFNGGTTVSDALWAGLPVVTHAGQAYASRMGASLLSAVRLPGLVADTPQAYEELAVQLALQPQRLQALREQLQRERLDVPLFDSAAFTRHLEAAYLRMQELAVAGEPPQHIRIA
ncbi:MAG TPA: tetratricopeptide repeat protein [Ramlibacter sp.]|nr:tetratricopeptide repeat protein [Ramlibacter sp.]